MRPMDDPREVLALAVEGFVPLKQPNIYEVAFSRKETVIELIEAYVTDEAAGVLDSQRPAKVPSGTPKTERSTRTDGEPSNEGARPRTAV